MTALTSGLGAMFAKLEWHDFIAGLVAILLTVGILVSVMMGRSIPPEIYGFEGLAMGYLFRGLVAPSTLRPPI